MWRTLTSVRFAVLQISALAVAGLIGTLVRQIPSFALHDRGAYVTEMSDLHRRYDPVTLLGAHVGPGMVDLFERLGFFRVFSAPWFTLMLTVLVASIVVCTLDRMPRLWRGVRSVRVVQPDAFFAVNLPDRASFESASLEPREVGDILRRRRYRVRELTERAAEGHAGGSATAAHEDVRYVYGDRNQYFKMATLLTHLGLILFLVGGAVTGAFGFETVVFVGDGQTAPVQPVGTPHNLLVKNLSFEAPRRPDGSFADFRTDLAVYQDGREVARKTIRVNDPLTVGRFVFHQNTFGPAADLQIRDPDGRLLWTGPVLLTEQLAGLPEGLLTIPGSPVGLLIVLARDSAGTPFLALQGLVGGAESSGNQTLFLTRLGLGATTDPAGTAGYSITWSGSSAFTGMVVKDDPGQGFIWLAFLSLISGLVLTFYFPRRRVWARMAAGGVQLAMVADRYVDTGKEFGELLDQMEARAGRRAARRPG